MTIHEPTPVPDAQATAVLLARVRTGCRHSRDEVLRRYGAHLKAMVRREATSVGDPLYALDDVEQTVVRRVLTKITAFRGATPPEFLAWMRVIVRNVVVDRGRRCVRRRTSGGWIDADSVAAQPVTAVAPELVAHLRSALQELASGDRRLVLLRMLEGVPFKDIGDRLGKSEDAVKKAHTRAIDRLRAVLVSNIARAGRQGGCS